MIRKRYVGAGSIALTALTLSLTACGGGSEAQPAASAPVLTATAPATPNAGPIGDRNRLQAALLTTAELPAGFVALPDPVHDLGLPPATTAAGADKSSTTPQECAQVLREVADQSPGSLARAAARFGGPDFASVDTDAASYPATGAAQAFTRVQSTLTQCTTYSGTDADGVHVDYRLGGLDQPTIGDASTAVRLTTSSDGVTMTSDVIIAVVGSTVLQVVASGQRPVEPAVLTGLARTAADRIRGAAVAG
ncbi:sensor domain-containing protein [Rhodococcus sp. NPDC127528]|uniref:sensor domain-containing protein n=1 Tax=unclassified Rhodococcus (in: high G+C Gram-positive bacteria) TaxID=192944 RepID=UPI00363E707C